MEADITKLIRPKPRHSNSKPKLRSYSYANTTYELPPFLKSPEVIIGSVSDNAIKYYPIISGNAFDSPRNLALHLVSYLAGVPVSKIFENRTHYSAALGCFAHIGAYSSWTSVQDKCDPEWGSSAIWRVRSYCWYYPKPFCNGKHISLCLSIDPSLLVSTKWGTPHAINVQIHGENKATIAMPNTYQCFSGFILPETRRITAIVNTTSAKTKFNKLLSLIKEMAFDVSQSLSHTGSLGCWRETSSKPIDPNTLARTDPFFNPTLYPHS